MRSLLRHLRFLAAVQLLPALESGEETTLVGGQAVLEGVMMRSPHAWGIRISLFLLFIWGISLWADIRRVYQYHGAEHKTVFAFENRDSLTIANAQKYVTWHPRCGTSFLMTVMLIAMFIYMLIPAVTFWG